MADQSNHRAAVSNKRKHTTTIAKPQTAKRQKYTLWDFSDLVTVIVGPQEERCQVPKAALLRCPWFERALSFSHSSDEQQTISFQGTELSVFNTYCTRAVGRTLPMYAHAREDPQVVRELVDLWTLGAFLQDVEFKNRIIDILVVKLEVEKGMTAIPEWEIVIHVWEETLPKATLRALLLDVCIFMDKDLRQQKRLEAMTALQKSAVMNGKQAGAAKLGATEPAKSQQSTDHKGTLLSEKELKQAQATLSFLLDLGDHTMERGTNHGLSKASMYHEHDRN